MALEGKLQGDKIGSEIQGFAPRVIQNSGTSLDVSKYVAFRVSEDVEYNIGGVVNATLPAGSIVVCSHLTTVNFATSVVVELM